MKHLFRLQTIALLFCIAIGTQAEPHWTKCTSLSDFQTNTYYMLVTTEPCEGEYYYVPASTGPIASGEFSKANGAGTKSTANPLSLTLSEAGWKLVKASKAGQYRWQSYGTEDAARYLYLTNDNNGVAIDNSSKASSYWTIAKADDAATFRFTYNLKSRRDLCPYLTSPYGFRSYAYSSVTDYSTHYLTVYKWTEEGDVPAKTETALQWSSNTATVTIGEENVFPTLTVQPEGLSGVVYSSSVPTVAAIDSQTGRVEILAEGMTVITATFTETDDYYGASASYTLTVKNKVEEEEVADNYKHDLLYITSTGVTSSSYTAFSDVQAADGSTAVYAGRVAQNAVAECFQLNGDPQNNIVTTASGGNVKKIKVYWASYMTKDENGRSLIVYGSHSAYDAKTSKVKGKEIGTLTYNTGDKSATIEVSDEYEYMMIVATAAIYFDKLDIAWDVPVVVRENLTVGNFGTICLPYAVVKGNYKGAEFYEVAGTTLNEFQQVNGLVLIPVDSLAAGTPYIFKATATTLKVSYSGTAVTAPVQTHGLVGNLSSEQQSVPATPHTYILFNNVIHKTHNGTATIAPNRAYIDLGKVSPYAGSHAKAVRVGLK
ncbi:MAG: hypothetical protein IJT97_02065 [Bacteroidaceae bacterium]|nr:hypothetical protein [Bacteroidaceae bacterium]